MIGRARNKCSSSTRQQSSDNRDDDDDDDAGSGEPVRLTRNSHFVPSELKRTANLNPIYIKNNSRQRQQVVALRRILTNRVRPRL